MKGANVVFTGQIPMLQCILQLNMEQNSGPKTMAVDSHWLNLVDPMRKADVYWTKT